MVSLGSVGRFELPYFTKKKSLHKIDIIDKLKNDTILLIEISWLSVLMSGNQDKY